MACPQISDLPLEEFGRDVINKWLANRVPLSGSIELDLRCNLRCLHCYRDGEWPADVLETNEVFRILDEVAAAGTIWMLFTGGEVFLRRDFFDIYQYARERGLKVTLFTNGTTVTPRIADRLLELPPYAIEITLYGYSKEVYERVTGVPGSHERCYRGVELLLERGLPLKLKTMLMKTNNHELMDMYRFADERGVHFKWDSMINPNFDGSMMPCNVRLSPEEVVEMDFVIPERLQEYREFYESRKDYKTSRVFSCGAGTRSFHIDPYGKLMMCLLLREPSFDLREMSFQEIWDTMFPPVYNQMRAADHQCNDCNLISLCGKCPAWSQMEKGRLDARVEYSCEVGHRRAERLGFWDGPVDQYTRKEETEEEMTLLPVIQ
jgi:radical SAM protein with 4Fe4S-binding SPASM domain